MAENPTAPNETIRECVRAVMADPSQEFDDDTPLFQDRLLDSFAIIELIGRLDEAFGIHIPNEALNNENFETVEAIARLTAKLIGSA